MVVVRRPTTRVFAATPGSERCERVAIARGAFVSAMFRTALPSSRCSSPPVASVSDPPAHVQWPTAPGSAAPPAGRIGQGPRHARPLADTREPQCRVRLLMRRLLKRLRARWGPALQSDTAFIDAAFRQILGRHADLDGLAHYRRVLRDGMGRTAVLLDIMRSEEFRSKLAPAPSSLPDLRARRPDRYRQTIDRSNGEPITVFDAASPADIDWLEQAILAHGYYEQPGVWNLEIDTDKRIIAEMMAAFAPARPLEIGCAAGAVLDCLHEHGIAAEGVEISVMAIARAPARVRERIHHGDLLSLELQPGYDLLFGLDVFEHLNPNRLDAYLSRLVALTRDSGYIFANIPAFGDDPVFGSIFPLYVDGWDGDAAAGRPFSTLHVDHLGYPIHGHLIWADARWWQSRFEAHGLRRDVEIERALHAKYDPYLRPRTPARVSYFVFSRGAAPSRDAIVKRIAAERSKVLG